MPLTLTDPSTLPAREQDPNDPEGQDAAGASGDSQQKLQSFGTKMSMLRDEWISYRASIGVDLRWREDLDQYEGRDSMAQAQSANMMKSAQAGFPVTSTTQPQATRSTIVVNQTRTKTNGAEARVTDIVLPTDDRNWSCEPTPLPMLALDLKSSELAIDARTGQPLKGPQLDGDNNPQVDPQTGQPIMVDYTKKQLAQAVQTMATQAAESMQDTIDDQLSTCDWHSECRRVIHDAAVLGTGVMRGPVVIGRSRRAWVQVSDQSGQQAWVQQVMKVDGPASWRVDPLNVWFDPGCGTDVHTGRGVIEVEDMTPRRVRDLADQPHFLPAQIAAVLREGPQRKRAPVTLQSMDPKGYMRTPNYEVWTYTGEVDIEDLQAAEVPGLPEIDSDEAVLLTVSAVITMVNNTVVKAVLNPLEDGSLPYDVLNWERSRDTVYGYGVPYLMRSPAKIMTSAWRMMMDNAGICAGPTIVMKKGAIQPQDGMLQITPRKIWLANDDIEDVTKAFTSVNFDSHQEELKDIIAMAEDLADKDTGVPQIMQGDQGSAPDTVGGMSILVNSSTVILRRIVKQIDDQLLEPHIERYYDWNMAYNDDNAIKGDYDVKARGSTALMIRDIQNQAYMQLLQIGMSGPLSMYIDDEKLARKIMAANKIPPSDVWRSQADIDKRKQAAAEHPQSDPRVDVAHIMAQAAVEKTQAVQHSREVESESRLELEKARLSFNSTESQQQRAHEMELAQLNRETAILKLATQEHISIQQVKADLAQAALVQRNENERFAADAQIKARQGSGLDGSVVGVGPQGS